MNLQDQAQVNKRLLRVALVNSIIGVFVAGLSTRIFMISLPTLAKGLGTDILGISWALIAYQVAGIGLSIVSGRLGDIYGHRKIYGFGISLMAVGSLLCAISGDVFQLILFRFVQGIGAAMIQSSGRALAFDAMPEGSEGKAQGFMAMAHQFGFFVGPPIGGLIIDLIHWRGVFVLLFLPSVVAIALTYLTGRAIAPAAARSRSRSVDYPGAALFFGLTLLTTMLLDQKIGRIIGAGNKTLLLLIWAGTLWAFLSHEKKIPSPMVHLSFFSIRSFGYGAIGLFAACITQGLAAVVMPFYLQDVLKLSPTFMGMIFLVPSVLSMALAPVSGSMTDRIGARLPLIVGVLFLMAAFLIGINLRIDSHWILPAGMLALTGIGSAFFNTPSQVAMVTALPKEHWGSAMGIINSIFGLGHMLGISLVGIFLTLAFRFYSGNPGTTPDPRDSQLFVASINVTYLFALAISFISLVTSATKKANKSL